jgi:hypothetical protein
MTKCFLVLATLLAPGPWIHAAEVDDAVVRTATWTEQWPNVSGAAEIRTVTAQV